MGLKPRPRSRGRRVGKTRGPAAPRPSAAGEPAPASHRADSHRGHHTAAALVPTLLGDHVSLTCIWAVFVGFAAGILGVCRYLFSVDCDLSSAAPRPSPPSPGVCVRCPSQLHGAALASPPQGFCEIQDILCQEGRLRCRWLRGPPAGEWLLVPAEAPAPRDPRVAPRTVIVNGSRPLCAAPLGPRSLPGKTVAASRPASARATVTVPVTASCALGPQEEVRSCVRGHLRGLYPSHPAAPPDPDPCIKLGSAKHYSLSPFWEDKGPGLRFCLIGLPWTNDRPFLAGEKGGLVEVRPSCPRSRTPWFPRSLAAGSPQTPGSGPRHRAEDTRHSLTTAVPSTSRQQGYPGHLNILSLLG